MVRNCLTILSMLLVWAGLCHGRQEAVDRPNPETAVDDPMMSLPLDQLDLLASLNAKLIELFEQGDYRGASAAGEKSLSILLKRVGKESQGVAVTMNNLAEIYKAMGNHDRAERLIGDSLSILRKNGGPKASISAVLNNLGSLYDQTGRYAEAETALLESLSFARNLAEGKNTATAIALNSLASVYKSKGNFSKAEEAYSESLDLTVKAFGSWHENTAIVLNNLSQVHYSTGNYASAERFLDQSIRISRRALGTDHPKYAAIVNSMAVVKAEFGQYQEAESLHQESLDIAKRILGEKHPSTATAMYNMARLYQRMGKYNRAEGFFAESLRVVQENFGEIHPATAMALHGLAGLYYLTGNFVQSEKLFKRSLEIKLRTMGDKHPSVAASLNDLGLLYHAMGDYARAEQITFQSLQLSRQLLGRFHPDSLSSLGNLASVYHSRRDYSKSLMYTEQEASLTQQAFGESHPKTFKGANNLAVLLQSMGGYDRARRLLSESLNKSREVLGEEHRITMTLSMNLAHLHFERGDVHLAEPLMVKALEVSRKVLGDLHPDTAISLSNFALLRYWKYDALTAEPLLRRGLKVLRQHLNLSATVLSERQQLRMSNMFKIHFSAWLSMSPEAGVATTEQYESVLSWKGAVTENQLALRSDLEDPRTQDLFAEWGRVSRELATFIRTVPNHQSPREWLQRLESLTNRKEVLESELSGRSERFDQVLNSPRVEELLRSLPAETALIDILGYNHLEPLRSSPAHPNRERLSWNHRLVAFVLRKDQAPVRVELGNVKEIREVIEDWRDSIYRSDAADMRRAADSTEFETPERVDIDAELHRLLWQPFEPLLENTRTILISPDDITSLLPWGALPGSRPGTYLIEEKSIVILPLASRLPNLVRQEAPSEPIIEAGANIPSLLLVGDVDYDGVPGVSEYPGESRSAMGRPRYDKSIFTRLPHTLSEMESLQGMFLKTFPSGRAVRLEKQDATESSVRKMAHRFRWLHLATHGFFAPPEVCSSVAMEPTDRKGSLFAQESIIHFHPGILSGLALTGANSEPGLGEDDGVFTAMEVSTLNLEDTDMVVLSACDTGLGTVAAGEGVLGLQRAFQLSGARTTVTSLWSVDDLATRLLMERFYSNLWVKSMNKIDALQEAQIWMMKEGSRALSESSRRGTRPRKHGVNGAHLPPYYWAAFVLSGEWLN